MTLIKNLATEAKTIRPEEDDSKVKLYSANLDLDIENKKLTSKINLLLATALTERVKRDEVKVQTHFCSSLLFFAINHVKFRS